MLVGFASLGSFCTGSLLAPGPPLDAEAADYIRRSLDKGAAPPDRSPMTSEVMAAGMPRCVRSAA